MSETSLFKSQSTKRQTHTNKRKYTTKQKTNSSWLVIKSKQKHTQEKIYVKVLT